MSDIIKITDSHLKLLNRMYVSWDNCEFGAPQINPKRPYGNFNVVEDILDIVGIPIKKDKDDEIIESLIDFANQLHNDMGKVLQIVLVTQRFEVGEYQKKEEYNDRSWEKLK